MANDIYLQEFLALLRPTELLKYIHWVVAEFSIKDRIEYELIYVCEVQSILGYFKILGYLETFCMEVTLDTDS